MEFKRGKYSIELIDSGITLSDGYYDEDKGVTMYIWIESEDELDFVINSLQTIRAELLSEGEHRQEILNEKETGEN